MRESHVREKLTRVSPLLLLIISTAIAEQPAEAPKTSPPKVVVRGSVVDDQGKPVAGASVRGVGVLTGRQGMSTRMSRFLVPERKTDDRGSFTLEVIGTKSTMTLRLTAQHKNAFTARAVEVRGDDLEKPITLTVSPRNARALRVRVVDENGKPVARAAVVVRHRPSGHLLIVQKEIKPVDLPKDTGHSTDRMGRLATPPCLAPDGSYQIELTVEGFFADKTPWKAMTDEPEIVFEATLWRLRSLEGQVLDRQGKPVAGVRVLRADERQKVETATDAKGHFRLTTAIIPPGFLFVSKSGFRFHGQRCDRAEPLKIVLTRREENAVGKMTTLSSAITATRHTSSPAWIPPPPNACSRF